MGATQEVWLIYKRKILNCIANGIFHFAMLSVICTLYSCFTLTTTCNNHRQFVLSVLLSVKRTKTPVTRAV